MNKLTTYQIQQEAASGIYFNTWTSLEIKENRKQPEMSGGRKESPGEMWLKSRVLLYVEL